MNHIKFRFYEELNIYLPEGNRKIWFDFYFIGIHTLREIFRSMKVPMTEIDLVLVNQHSKDLDYEVQDRDRISVFPIFESLDISGITKVREKPLRNPTFICDVHLGRLCRYLRMLGFDTAYSNRFSPTNLIEQSIAEKRILLSKSYRLTHYPKVERAYRIRSSDPEEQIKDLICHLSLADLADPFTRCLNCNSELQSVQKSEVREQLQPNTAKYYDEFLRCPSCNKLFWEGSHYEHMLEFIQEHLMVKQA